MKQYKKIFMIKCITNMHVGSGDINFNIVDNEIQKDVITKYPTINSSSLKGALREHFENKYNSTKRNIDERVEWIFGGEDNSGKYKFFSANILTIPARSNRKPFFNATTKSIVDHIINNCNDFNIEIGVKQTLEKLSKLDNKNYVFKEKYKDLKLEGKAVEYSDILNDGERKSLSKLFGQDFVLLSSENFKKLTDNLPVIARNKLENGTSKNLWYEEVLPRESRFYFILIHNEKYFEEFYNELTSQVIQIGANASLGYGYSRIEEVGEING